MQSVRIESMRPGDIIDVLAIDAASFEGHRATEASLREELARPWSHLWVARAGSGRASAYIIVWHVADELHVLNVATDPAARRRGHARALMERTLEFAQRGDVRLVVLEVRRSNQAAIALYRAMGFFAMALRAGYYSDGEDAIEMMLLLDPGTRQVVFHEDEVRI